MRRYQEAFKRQVDRQARWLANWLYSRSAYVVLVYGTLGWIPLVIFGVDRSGFLYLYIATSLSLVTQNPLAMLGKSAAAEARRAEEGQVETLKLLVGLSERIVADLGEQEVVMHEALMREAMHQAFKEAPDAQIIVDEEGAVVLVNDRVEGMLGYTPAELVGHKIEMLVPEAKRSGHEAQREGYQADPHPREMGAGLDLTARKKDGTELPVNISLSPIHFADRRVTLAVIRDVTDRRALENTLKHALSTSIAEINRMAEALNVD